MDGSLVIGVLTRLRRLFYAVTPNETSFPTVEEVPKYVDEAIPFFIGLIILEIPILYLRGKRLPRFNDSFGSLANGILSLLHGLLFRSVELTTYIWVYEHWNVIDLHWDSAWTWILGFVGVDLGYYWVHRCGHEVNLMWAGHQVHHSSEDYNLVTALRQSTIHRYVGWMFYLPLALVMPPSVFLVHSQFNLLYQFWIHTETVDTLGPLEWILNTPSHHRVHHGRNRYCIDKNYGGTLIIFDRMFGTFAKEQEEVVYGLVHPLTSWDPINAQICHLRYMWTAFKETKGFQNKLAVIWKGPGWAPGKPRTGLMEDIPDIHAPQEKFDRQLPLWINLYIWTHMLLLIVFYGILAHFKTENSPYISLTGVVFIVFTLSSFGALYDHRSRASLQETVRCFVFLLIVRGFATPSAVSSSPGLSLIALYLASFAIWFFVCVRQISVKIKAKSS
ncbi:alkylglycerol monooxygenase-like isoform X2 [Ostrea edulis]|uniref:alkylglycerol monooxygenase-like isoform X2 n=1 Tax=Ostrea edulis TaxID=37623 RepID=UPI002094CE58|nr:alkylglycerol monooxygenase-like isoform X2 [Ostrea edulis]